MTAISGSAAMRSSLSTICRSPRMGLPLRAGLVQNPYSLPSRQYYSAKRRATPEDTREKYKFKAIERSKFQRGVKKPDGPAHFQTKMPDNWTPTLSETASGEKQILLEHPELQAPAVLHPTWLRDACTCPKCVDPSSGQKRFATVDVPLDLSVERLARTEDGSLEVQWSNDFLTGDTHTTHYDGEFVKRLFGAGGAPVGKTPPPGQIMWDREGLEEVKPFFEFEQFMNGEADYATAMTRLRTHGLIFLKNVPSDEKMVEEITKKIGMLQETFYGRSWDVVSKPDAENVAYTNTYLGLHQDLLYMDSPPGVQLLHCLKNSCEGGESLFSDGMRAACMLAFQYPHLSSPLTEHQIGYHYDVGENHYFSYRPVLNKFQPSLYWSPPFQFPQQRVWKTTEGAQLYHEWLKAAHKVRELIDKEPFVYEYKMQEGDCVIFDNIRILHGRRQFDTSSGERFLKGAYVSSDSYRSKIEHLAPQMAPVAGPNVSLTDQGNNMLQRHPAPDANKIVQSKTRYLFWGWGKFTGW
ncbi:Clavaminate synthase-like protein [Xylariomycetidae sp. FL0641]|nr:Clavaminate synthase-like protein [Xylariomycetidae sp. FL0641]